MRRAARSLGVTLALMVTVWTATAAAQSPPGPWVNELGGGIGFAAGLNTAPGGFKLEDEYGRKLNNLMWLNLQLNFVLGGGDWCGYDRNGHYVCTGDYRWGGDAIEMIGGVKFKFLSGRLQPHAKIGGGMVFSFWGAGDANAVAIVVRGGGGLKYWVLPRFAVGGELNVSLGPNFIYNGGTHLYAALDFIAAVEFLF